MKPTKKIRKQFKEQPVVMTQKQIDKMKEESLNHALNVIVGMSLLTLRDEFGFGHERLLRYQKRFENNVDAYNKNYLNMQDVWDTLGKETKIKFDGE